jgi:hypothetical protein
MGYSGKGQVIEYSRGTGQAMIQRQAIPRGRAAWVQACASCTVTPPPALGAAIAYHRANVEDLLYGGYSDAGSPAAPRTTWIRTSKWAVG